MVHSKLFVITQDSNPHATASEEPQRRLSLSLFCQLHCDVQLIAVALGYNIKELTRYLSLYLFSISGRSLPFIRADIIFLIIATYSTALFCEGFSPNYAVLIMP
jgi:hypothetical protein